MCGLIAAIDSNGIGVAGINWRSQLYVAMAADEAPFSSALWYPDPRVAGAVEWATREDVDVINMSFGHIDNGFQGAMRSLWWGNELAASLYNAWQKGILLIASKGNDSSSQFNFPSDLPTVMGVGACNWQGNRASFSNYGDNLDILARGDYGYTTATGNTYDHFGGTSMAAPVATGVASLIKSFNPSLTADEIEQTMEITALNTEGPGWHADIGWGILKADSAMRFVANNMFFRKEALSGSRQLVQGGHEHTFYNNGGLATGTYFGVEKYRITAHFSFAEYGFTQAPVVMIRHRGSKGWSAANPNNEFAWSRIVPGSVTTTGCDVETYAYLVKYNLLGQSINKWYPCDGTNCQSGPDIKFKITIAGRPHVLAPASLQGTATVLDYPTRQATRIYWPDNNSFESGWVIQRRALGSQTWETLDSIITLGTATAWYDDTSFVGSETYDYRVGPYVQGDEPAWSPQATIKALPRWPHGLNARVLWLSQCSENSGIPRLGVQPEPEPRDSTTCPSSCLLISWSAPNKQKLPITSYRICQTLGTEPFPSSYFNVGGTSLTSCCLETNRWYLFEICAYDSEGDSSFWSDSTVLIKTGWYYYCDQIQRPSANTSTSTIFDNCYPNPFNMSTTISFSLAEEIKVTADIYNILGQCINHLQVDRLSAGRHSLTWDGTDEGGRPVSSGVYFLRFEAGTYVATRKMLLMK